MIVSARQPSSMSPEQIVEEVAFHLATAYLRLAASRRKALEVPTQHEALCAPRDGKDAVAGKEPR